MNNQSIPIKIGGGKTVFAEVMDYNWLTKRIKLYLSEPVAFEEHRVPQTEWKGPIEKLFVEGWVDKDWCFQGDDGWFVDRLYRDKWRWPCQTWNENNSNDENEDTLHLKAEWRCFYCRQKAAPSANTPLILGWMLHVRPSDLERVASFSPVCIGK